MKRYISMVLAVLLLATCVLTMAPEVDAAKKPEKTRAIAIVFDNSGTMYLGDAESKITWCRATYATQALATMMNPSDIMQIYPMNPIQIGDSDSPKDSDIYTMERPLVVKKEDASLIQEICTPHAGDTHIEAVVSAREGLAKTNADEKWLIVLTDGTVFYRDGKELSTQESIRQLTDELNQSVQKVNTMYLGIGKEAQSGFAVNGSYQYEERKATTSAEVLKNLTELGNIIFGRDALTSVSKNVSFDVSMKKLIVFIQGDAIDNVVLSGATPISTDKLKYSTYGAKNYKSVCDTSLQGTMLTFENLDAGSYTINFSGQASDIAVYYEPDADLDFVFTDAAGNLVDPQALYEGDYKVSFGMKDAKTGKLSSSSLLGEPKYQGTYYINGQEYVITHEGFNGSVNVPLKMGEKFEAKLTVTYLSGYIISKDSTDFGWPEGGITVAARPAGDMYLEVSGGEEEFSLQNLEEGAPYIVKVFYKGTQLTGDALKSTQLTWDAEASNATIESEVADDHYQLKLKYKDPNAPEQTICGECRVPIAVRYAEQGSDEATAQGAITYNIKDDFSPLRMEILAPQDYIVIKELQESQPITVLLKLNGQPLSVEDFAAVNLTVDCGGIEHTITPNPEASSYTIKLLPTEGITEGDYTIMFNAVYTDHIGRETATENGLVVTLSNMSLLLKWLIRLGILLLLLLIIWLISRIPAMPKHVVSTKNDSQLTIGPSIHDTGITFPTERSGKTLKVLCRKGAMKFGLSMHVEPGEGSYISTPQKNRSMAVKPGDVSIQSGGTKITRANINGVVFEINPQTNRFEVTQPGIKQIKLRNGTQISYEGKIMDGGKNKSFTVTTKLDFKKK